MLLGPRCDFACMDVLPVVVELGPCKARLAFNVGGGLDVFMFSG